MRFPLRYIATEPRDIGTLRRCLTEALADAGLDQEASGDVVVMTSELVANALTHTASPAQVHVELGGRSVHVTVSDDDHATPVLRPRQASRVGGNGIRIVDALADEWGTTTHPGDGKDVWFRLRW